MVRWLLALLAACGGREMVDVPGGSFVMGCDAAIDRCEADELPAHGVTVSAFALDRDEVSERDYARCVDAGACSGGGAGRSTLPVVYVTWEQADRYCEWIGGRLPTEAEWERAARGDDARIYPWGNDPPDCTLANLFGCGDAIQPVGGHDAGASPYGARDMAGNVMEWVADFYDADYYAVSGGVDPMGPPAGLDHVKRGGSYVGDADTLRAANRVEGFPVGLPNLGFRCAQ